MYPRISNIKFHLFVTFALILFIAMALACSVVLIMQQHNSIQEEIERSKRILAAVSTEIISSKEKSGQSRDLLLSRYEIDENKENENCIVWNYSINNEMNLDRCKNVVGLERLFIDKENQGNLTVSYSGSVWAVFTYANRNLIVTSPLKQGEKIIGSVAIIKSLVPLYKTIRKESEIAFVYIFTNAIIFATIGLFRLISLVVKPIEKLVVLAEKFQFSDGKNFLIGQSSSEFAKLSKSLNEMLQRIEKDNKKLRDTIASLEKANIELDRNRHGMVQTEKLAAVGRLSAGIAHEIGNPLGIVQGYVDMLGKVDLTGEEKEQFAKRAGQELQRINALIRQLLDYARTSSEHFARIAVHDLIRDVIKLLPARKRAENFSLITTLDAEVDTVFAVGDRLRQVFLNCLLNAIDAVELFEIGQGEIVISTRNAMDDKGNALLELRFSDNGIGIPPEHLEIVFDPFFTTKAPGKGTGLGLAVSYAIIENFGGKISVAPRLTGGTEVLISLPISDYRV